MYECAFFKKTTLLFFPSRPLVKWPSTTTPTSTGTVTFRHFSWRCWCCSGRPQGGTAAAILQGSHLLPKSTDESQIKVPLSLRVLVGVPPGSSGRRLCWQRCLADAVTQNRTLSPEKSSAAGATCPTSTSSASSCSAHTWWVLCRTKFQSVTTVYLVGYMPQILYFRLEPFAQRISVHVQSSNHNNSLSALCPNSRRATVCMLPFRCITSHICHWRDDM